MNKQSKNQAISAEPVACETAADEAMTCVTLANQAVADQVVAGEIPPVEPAAAEAQNQECRAQLAALCWRMQSAAPQILLITSRDTGRWIVPKGWPMKGRSPAEAAATEAWEEAGVIGNIASAPLGSFIYDKVLRRADVQPCKVQVFPLEVHDLASDFPEKNQRRRKWFSPDKAARKVAEPELRALIIAFGGGLSPAEGQTRKVKGRDRAKDRHLEKFAAQHKPSARELQLAPVPGAAEGVTESGEMAAKLGPVQVKFGD